MKTLAPKIEFMEGEKDGLTITITYAGQIYTVKLIGVRPGDF